MQFNIQTRESRMRLDVREKPYYTRITASLHLGYRKGKSIARWVVRARTRSGYRTHVLERAVPDDRLAANGTAILSYQQAIIRAMNMDTVELDSCEQGIRSCGFCKKLQTEVKVLIAGPGVYICDECVVLCNGIIIEHKLTQTPHAPSPQ